MATSILKNDDIKEVFTLKSAYDFPLIMQETGNEDFKGIAVKDSNGTLRYRLIFQNGGLLFTSFAADGTVIRNVHLVPESGGGN